MNFTEVVAEVVSTTKRPELINIIRRKVNAAITFYSLDNEFMRDYAEVSPAIDAAEYTQALALSTFTRFRKFKYIKQGGTKKFLKPIPDSELFKDCINPGTYYIIGDSVNLHVHSLCSTLDVGWFKYPPFLTDAATNNSYWMLDVSPFMIIERAAADIFRDMGDERSMNTCMISARDFYSAFRKDMGISTQ